MISDLVSVIIPAYNQAQFINYAIDSVIAQSYKKWECVIVDDGSTDATRTIIHSYTHPGIKYVHQHNQGLSAARNTGMASAQGEFLSFLDSDDGFIPENLMLLVSEMNNDPDLALVAGRSIMIDDNNQVIDQKFKQGFSGKPYQLLFENPMNIGNVLLRRSWQEKIGWFDVKLRSYEDWDYWLRLAIAGGKIASIPKPVSYYRFHGDQMTRNASQMTKASFEVLDNVFKNSLLPSQWLQHKDTAFSHAHLRAAANAYLLEDILTAKEHLTEASQLNPHLCEDGGKVFIQKTFGWTEIPKVKEPLKFLTIIYKNLPKDIDHAIGRKMNTILADFAIQKAFLYFQNEQYNQAGKFARKGVQYDRKWLRNRGVLRIIAKSWINS